jgi:hypothetical protein
MQTLSQRDELTLQKDFTRVHIREILNANDHRAGGLKKAAGLG